MILYDFAYIPKAACQKLLEFTDMQEYSIIVKELNDIFVNAYESNNVFYDIYKLFFTKSNHFIGIIKNQEALSCYE